jgi:acyl-CoA synthetase (AMP-forming)/AMP-acid ligase II
MPEAGIIDFLEGSEAAAPCLLDDTMSDWLTYGELRDRASRWCIRFGGNKALVFLYAHNDCETVAALLGGISAGHAVALLDPKLPLAGKQALASAYSPEFVIQSAATGEVAKAPPSAAVPHTDLSLLLSTSGSTGSPKFVRLTLKNVLANARAIADVLSIGSDSVASGHLPLHYSYGLSVLTSHLASGARVALTNSSFMDRGLWKQAKDAGVSHLPGVPFHFSIVEKLGYQRLDLPNLQCLTQAGGHLDVAARERAHLFMEQRGGRFYVMYGQTEAAPRMTTLQHKDFPQAPASVGKPLPGGMIRIHDPDENGFGEVVYSGPNVAMGYAEARSDLAEGDVLDHVLHTGDLGFLDDSGRLTLTGRVKRSAKVFGLRVNLDEVEKLTNQICPSAAIELGERLSIFYTDDSVERLRALLLSNFSLPAASYCFRSIGELPRTERGKIDYRALEALT